MPCTKYKGKQRRLCFATKEWKDWSKIKKSPKSKIVKDINKRPNFYKFGKKK